MKRGLRTANAVILATLVNLSSLPVHADLTEPLNPPVAGSDYPDASEVPYTAGITEQGPDLATIVDNIEPISRGTRVRRSIVHATFCLPQNILGTLYYGLLQLTGNVVGTADMNETKIIVTSTPFGASLGKYIFINKTMQTENTVRHEYGHTMQGYKHGPFYLLFEGLASFVQATISLFSPSFAEAYFDRWPENEANELGGVTIGTWFDVVEVRLLAAEEKAEALQAQLNNPDVAGDHERLHATYEAHREAQGELDRLFARWEELERKALGE